MDPCDNESAEAAENPTGRSACYIAQLPDTVIVEIFLKIPFITLVQCFCVCKSWFNILSDPKFAHLRYSRETSNIVLCKNKSNLYILNDRRLGLAANFLPIRSELINSCNGLVCMRRNCTIDVLNPINGERVSFPPSKGIFKMEVCGFGHCSTTNEYKIFRVVYYKKLRRVGDWESDSNADAVWPFEGDFDYDRDLDWDHHFYWDEDDSLKSAVAEVYTLGTGSWRRIKDAHLREAVLGSDEYISHTYLDGSLYWVAVTHGRHFLTSFDFEAERFRELPASDYFFSDYFLGLGTLGNHLRVCRYEEPDYDSLDFDFIAYNSETESEYEEPNGVDVFLLKGSWTKHAVIKFPKELQVDKDLDIAVNYFENGDIQLLHGGVLYLYSPSKGTFKSFNDRRLQLENGIAHVPSLISLRDVLKGETLEVSNVKPKKSTKKRPKKKSSNLKARDRSFSL